MGLRVWGYSGLCWLLIGWGSKSLLCEDMSYVVAGVYLRWGYTTSLGRVPLGVPKC